MADTRLGPPADSLLIDIRAFARKLPQPLGKLRKAARQWLDAHSGSCDLRLAKDYVEDAQRLAQQDSPGLDNATAALLQGAVILYARPFDDSATHHRGTLPLISKLTAESQRLHRQVIELRHKGVAHFDGGGVSRPWSVDYATIIIEHGRYQTMSCSNRALFQPRFAAEFHDHLAVTCALADGLADSRRVEFERQFREAWSTNDEIDRLLLASKLDPEVLHGWDGPVLGGLREGRSITVVKGDPTGF